MTGNLDRCSNRRATQRPKGDTPRLSQGGKMVRQFSDLSTYAEKMLVHENALVKITKEIPLDRAALIGCGVTTGVGAVLNTAKIEPGSTVAVFGCGGVGISAIQGAKLAGARQIIAVDQFENKLAMAKALWRDPHRRRLRTRRGRSDQHDDRRRRASITHSKRWAWRSSPSNASTVSSRAEWRRLSG